MRKLLGLILALLLLTAALLPPQSALANLASSSLSTALKAKAEGDGVLLTWQPFGTPHDGYYLFRGRQPNDYDPVPLTDFPLLTTRFVDRKAEPGHTYYYQVRTYRKDSGLYPSASQEAAVTLAAAERTFTGRAQSGRVVITWNPFGLPHDGYYLHRGTTAGQYDPVPLTDFPLLETTFTDTKVEDGRTYYYAIRPYQMNPGGQGSTEGTGLAVDWQTPPTGTTTSGSTDLGVDWVNQSALGEQVIRTAYQRAFGREPTAAELKQELDRQSYDQSVRTLPALLEHLRAYLKSYKGIQEFQATVNRALKVVPVDRSRIDLSGLLYSEMVRLLTIHGSYQTAFGREPTPTEVLTWPEEVQAESLLAAHREMIKQERLVRDGVIERAYRKVWQRSPVAEEAQRWESDLAATGKTYSELVAAISAAHDPIKPQAPKILRHQAAGYWTTLHTRLYFLQQGEQAVTFRVLRQIPPSYDWKELGTLPAEGDGKEHMFKDPIYGDRVYYKVCAVNPHGESCTEPYATTEKPNRVRITSARADSPTQLTIHWERVGEDVTEMAVRRQKPDGSWEEVSRQKATTFSSHRFVDQATPGQRRTYQVCSFNKFGETCTFPIVINLPVPRAVAPTGFTVRAENQIDWTLSWHPQGNDPVRLQRWNSQRRQWEQLAQFNTGQARYSLREESGDAFYEYRVCAWNGYNEACSPSVKVGKQFDHPTNFTSLDYGVYWFRCGTCRGSTRNDDNGTQSDGVKAVPGVSREYFDPTRPTVIYVHGWARESVKKHSRESMKSPIDQQSMMDAWLAAGWNVGVFYWNSFSDDDWGFEPRFAEAKIDNGDITWSQSDGKGNSSFASTRVKEPASALLARSIIQAMQEYKGPEFRLVGHSLGSQMVVMGAYQVSISQFAHLTPKRVALLDPWISSGGRAGGLGELIDRVKRSHGTVYEYYQTSAISQEHGQYGSRAVTSRVHPDYANWDPRASHAAAIHWYFNSMSLTMEAPTARMPLEQLRPLMDCSCRYEQHDGKKTPTLTDDTFHRHSK